MKKIYLFSILFFFFVSISHSHQGQCSNPQQMSTCNYLPPNPSGLPGNPSVGWYWYNTQNGDYAKFILKPSTNQVDIYINGGFYGASGATLIYAAHTNYYWTGLKEEWVHLHIPGPFTLRMFRDIQGFSVRWRTCIASGHQPLSYNWKSGECTWSY